MRKMYLILGAVIILAVLGLKTFFSVPYDIVVYGGGFAGSAAARSAAAAAPQKKVLLIVPDTSQRLGGLGTAGGQNFTDIRLWQGQLVTAGSFGRWFNEAGQFYNTEAMSEIIARDLAQFKNLTVLFSQDIQGVQTVNSVIKSIKLAPIERGQDGFVRWGSGVKTVKGRIFIDASDEGKLASLSGAALSQGRQDWPAQYHSEKERQGHPYQQAATLMFKVKGVQTPSEPMRAGDLEFVRDSRGSWGLIGGKETWKNNPLVMAYNQEHAQLGLAVKPINAAQDGAGSDQWWVNMLLVFHVDGRLHARDQEMGNVPFTTCRECRNIDQAWTLAREYLAKPEFLQVLRQFKVILPEGEYGFGAAELVLDQDKLPVVGEVMYIRESVHSLTQAGIQPTGQENNLYALTTKEVQHAGTGPAAGLDIENYQERIGLAYYMMDINAYQPEDLLHEGSYQWPVTGNVRPDWQQDGGQPVNPVYLPYQVLVNPAVHNLLLPGYAAGASSMAWAELRVLPNLTVLGDAAGVAAARAVLNNELPYQFGPQQIQWVQTKLQQFGARLDK